jgi:hypothetical protein
MPLPDPFVSDPQLLRDLTDLDSRSPLFTGEIADGSITEDKLADSAVSSEKLGLPWTVWTPTWTNVTVGDGTVTARSVVIDTTCHFQLQLIFGASTSVSGQIGFSLPFAVATPGRCIVTMLEFGVSERLGVGDISGTDCTVSALDVATYVRLAATSSTIPFTWGTLDQLLVTGTYETT